MQGLGVFGCRRAAWPGLQPPAPAGSAWRKGYLHEKIRRAGGRTLCLPFLGWTHRFNRPFGHRYPRVGGGPGSKLPAHAQRAGSRPRSGDCPLRAGVRRRARAAAGGSRRAGTGGAVSLLRRDLLHQPGLTRPAAGNRSCVSARPWASTIASAASPPSIPRPARGIGRALSHRGVVAEAKWQGLDSVLVLEDDVIFSRRTADVLAQSLAELREREWGLLSLSVGAGDDAVPRASGGRFSPDRAGIDVFCTRWPITTPSTTRS